MAAPTLRDILNERHREILLLLMVMSSAFAVISLAGWHAGDPTPLHPGTGRVENYCGPVGATLADALLMFVGYGAWAVAMPMVAGVLALAGRRVWYPVRTVSALAVYICALALTHAAMGPGGAFPAGGAVGRNLLSLLEASTGTVGAGLLLCSGVLLGATIAFDIDWRRVSAWTIDRLEVWAPWLAHGVFSRVSAAVAAVRSLSGKGLWGMWSLIVGIATRTRSAAGRMLASFARSEHEDGPDADWVSVSEFDDITGGPDSLPPSRVDDATQVAGAAVLAEVEWDPTGYVSDLDDPMPSDIGPLPIGAGPAMGLMGAVPSSPSSSGPSTFTRSVPTPSSTGGAAPVAAIAIPTPTPVPASYDEEPSEDPPAVEAIAERLEVHIPAKPAVVKAKASKSKDVPAEQEPMFDPVEISKAPYLDLSHRDDGKAVGKNDGPDFQLPPLSVLDEVPEQHANIDELELQGLALTIEEKLNTFKVGGKVVGVRPGPVVTIFEFRPAPGVKVSKISNLQDDLMMALRARALRIVAPIPGRDVVGIEVPSKERLTIYLRELLASPLFKRGNMALPCVLGKDVEAKPLIADLAKMPHLLIGGSTGSGKSVGVNGMLMSLLFSMSPEDLRFILVDPKMLEFQLYNDIPHLLHPVITDPAKAAGALAWACVEMDRRYELIARWEVRNLKSYNKKVAKEARDWTEEKARKYAPSDWPDYEPPPGPEKLPYIVIVIDELADLMQQAKKDVEGHIARLAAKARACGIHLIIATQRPSVDVLTGVIKTNLPTRIAYKLQSSIDSRTVVNSVGAEKLLGMGDMLFIPPGSSDLLRGHAPFVSDGEVKRVCDFLRDQKEPDFIDVSDPSAEAKDVGDDRHPQYRDAVEYVVSKRKASTSSVQRQLSIGYNKAADIIDCMEADGFIGPADGARPRKVLIEEVPSWL